MSEDYHCDHLSGGLSDSVASISFTFVVVNVLYTEVVMYVTVTADYLEKNTYILF